MREDERVIHRVADLVLDYLQDSSTNGKRIGYKDAAFLQKELDLHLPEWGTSLEALVPIVESYLQHSTRTNDRQFFNQLWGGSELPGAIAEMVTGAANTSMYTYEVAPVATLMERKLIEALCDTIGFEDGEGIMVSGGSNANALGMLCARHRCLPQVKYTGSRDRPPVAFVSDRAHYSFLKAANLLGIGMENTIAVPTDGRDRMDVEKLEAAIARSLDAGKIPFFVGATAGTTVSGAFDPIPAIAEVSRKYGLWLHIDGAWGGPVLFSRQYEHLLAGSELADSFTWDAHKLLGIPLVCSFFLTKEKGILLDACSSSGTDYIFHEDENSTYDLGPISLQCGRKVDAFKLWLSWQYHGRSGYETRVDRLFELAKYATQWVRNCDRLELVLEPTFLNVCFRYNPSDRAFSEGELDAINLKVRERLMRSGQAFVNYARVRDRVVIRLILANPKVREEDIDTFFQSLLECARLEARELEKS